MKSIQKHIHSKALVRHNRKTNQTLTVLSILILCTTLLTGCMGTTPLHLQNHFPTDVKASEALKGPFSPDTVTAGVAIALLPNSYDFLTTNEAAWTQLAARVRHDMKEISTLKIGKVVLVDNLGAPESIAQIKKFGTDSQVDTVLVVIPSGDEISGPARFDLLPEVSLLNGSQTEHHATVEIGLVDVKSGKLLMQVQGNSYATLEELDTPIDSNRYPRLRGSGMSSYIYPEKEKAKDALQAVAIDQALQQATMKFQEKWRET